MHKRVNPNYLRQEQYVDAQNLNARVALHRRFSTNPVNWFHWVFDHINIPGDANILEVGCGPGLLWKHNLDRIPLRWRFGLTDFSPGMLLEAQDNLGSSHAHFHYTAADAQNIPFPDATFDLVVANHMLYHVPDRPKAITELHRVLKSGGWLLAATNGLHHMAEIHELLMKLDPAMAKETDHAFGVSEFTIENGAEQLSAVFTEVHLIPFIDSLEVTEAEPLLDYILSMTSSDNLPLGDHKLRAFQQLFSDEIRHRGSFHISKYTSLIMAHKL